MKPIQVLFDEKLLESLDADDEVQRRGRSAVLREAAAEYLRRRRHTAIARRYEEAYGDGSGVDDDLEGWSEEGIWPDGD